MSDNEIVRLERAEEDRSALELFALLAARWRLLVALPLLVAVSAALFSLLLPRRYTVDSRFIPESNGAQVSRLAGLAAQFGVDIGGGETVESIDFYAELLESQDLLRSAALTEYSFEDRDGAALSGTLVELLEAKGKTPDERVRHAVESLERMVVARPDPGAHMVTLRTSAPWPELAVLVNRRLLELLSEFNLERRQSRAAAERRFLESRVAEAERDLRGAEAELERFLSENRRYAESPQLTFEHGRLQRRVDLRQQIHTSLAQGFEQARVDEVRNTPVITVVDQPRGPAEKTAPNIIVNAVLGLVLGSLLALALVLGGHALVAMRAQAPGGARREGPPGPRPARPRPAER